VITPVLAELIQLVGSIPITSLTEDAYWLLRGPAGGGRRKGYGRVG